MRLYSGLASEFVEEVVQNRIVKTLSDAFVYELNYAPPISEVNSWRNSLRTICLVFQDLRLSDQGIILEYQLPLSSKRLDCLVCGVNTLDKKGAVIIELKQWEKCDSSSTDKVLTFIGGNTREVLHPSVQVGSYKLYLEENHTAFYENDEIQLNACAFLHNYPHIENDPLFAITYKPWLDQYPIFLQNNVEDLKSFLRGKVEKGHGRGIVERIEESTYRPSKQLLKHVGNVINNKTQYVLLDDQLLAFDRIINQIKTFSQSKKKGVIIVNGGPGTGKSVIALNVMAKLLKENKNVQYATGSKAFTETLRKIIGTRGAAQFKYFNSYTTAPENIIDVLLADEAHRLRTTSNNRFTPKRIRSNIPQIEELITVSKVPVFFIDDRQNVRAGEIGSVSYIKEHARRLGCDIFEYTLDIQFRCQGSDKFVKWVEQTLDIRDTTQALWHMKKNDFELKIANSPRELYSWINEHNKKEPNSARLVAGFCWPWSNAKPDGSLVKDVVIDDFNMSWEGKDGQKLAKDIPPASLWPYDPRGVNQIGSIYTIQGFEFNYVGVIFGKDLMYNFETNKWEAHPENSYDTVAKRDKEKFIDLAKNAYRVLLSRAMRGCYVYFVDKETEKFIKSRIQFD